MKANTALCRGRGRAGAGQGQGGPLFERLWLLTADLLSTSLSSQA